MNCDFKNKEWLISMLKEYKTPNEICKNTGCSETSIRRYIKLYKLDYLIDKNFKCKKKIDLKRYPYKNPDWLIEKISLYKNVSTICKNTGYPETSIRRYIKLYELQNLIEHPKSKRNHTLNENYFEAIDNEHKAYWLGLLMADGNVTNTGNKYCIRISLKNEDIYLLEEMKKDIGSDTKIEIDKYKRGTLRVFSKKMFLDLNKLYIIPKKTGKEKLPILRKDLYKHFFRGFFDGDGTIYKRTNRERHKCTIGYCCQNEDFIKQLNDLTLNECNFIIPYYKHVNNVYEAKTESFAKCKVFAEWIYKDATIAMKRKYNRAKEYLEYICPSLEGE